MLKKQSSNSTWLLFPVLDFFLLKAQKTVTVFYVVRIYL